MVGMVPVQGNKPGQTRRETMRTLRSLSSGLLVVLGLLVFVQTGHTRAFSVEDCKHFLREISPQQLNDHTVFNEFLGILETKEGIETCHEVLLGIAQEAASYLRNVSSDEAYNQLFVLLLYKDNHYESW